ncbi:MAG TPA: hypothetical protein VGK65_20815 [Candidatus Binatia bacterium]|jgi:hypothetical protein
MFEWEDKLVKELERLGEEEVRKGYISGRFGSPGSTKALVTERWLAELDSKRRSAREEETLAIARDALSNSRRANIIAIIAMIFSAAVAIIAAIIGLKSN